jgi:nitroreductase
MDTFTAIRERRAVKHYDPEHRMSESEIDLLFDLAMQSPTCFNIQHWRFVLVQDPEIRKAIRAAANDQVHVTDASILIVICADVLAWQKEPERYWSNAPQEVQDWLVPWMGPFHEGKPEQQRDEGMRSVGIAAQTIMLAAKAMGYDSCPMIGFDPIKVGEIIRLPEDHAVGMFVVVGKGTKLPWPKPGRLPMDEILIRDRFS